MRSWRSSFLAFSSLCLPWTRPWFTQTSRQASFLEIDIKSGQEKIIRRWDAAPYLETYFISVLRKNKIFVFFAFQMCICASVHLGIWAFGHLGILIVWFWDPESEVSSFQLQISNSSFRLGVQKFGRPSPKLFRLHNPPTQAKNHEVPGLPLLHLNGAWQKMKKKSSFQIMTRCRGKRAQCAASELLPKSFTPSHSKCSLQSWWTSPVPFLFCTYPFCFSLFKSFGNKARKNCAFCR